jgi:hypothetical protein
MRCGSGTWPTIAAAAPGAVGAACPLGFMKTCSGARRGRWWPPVCMGPVDGREAEVDGAAARTWCRVQALGSRDLRA